MLISEVNYYSYLSHIKIPLFSMLNFKVNPAVLKIVTKKIFLNNNFYYQCFDELSPIAQSQNVNMSTSKPP